MQITLRQLRIFEAVARHGSISRAADELGLTQPAVSMQIKQMEDQLGLVFVEQVGKKFALTDAGQELCYHAAQIGKQTAEMLTSMEQFRELERGVLRVAVVSTANYFLPPLIADFSARHPGVRVSLKVANREAVLAAVSSNEAELAILGHTTERVDMVAQVFMDNPLVVIAPPDHPLASMDCIELRQIENEMIVIREQGSGTRAAMERFFDKSDINYQPGCELNTNEAIKQAVQAGLGIGVVPAQTIELELQTGRLVVLPFKGFPIIRRWFVIHRSDKRLSNVALAFRTRLFDKNFFQTSAGIKSGVISIPTKASQVETWPEGKGALVRAKPVGGVG
jgi:molybdate transport repressor ModE-like protein